jgi:hypothetical protein
MKIAMIIIGVVLILFGGLWTLQGLDLLGQSGGMNGVKAFAIIGPIVAVIGLILLIFGARRKSTAA